ncbi:MAG TPA: hypothetical protein P5318_03880 [Candidatus Hydrogenedentes bacterium]|nr:hypothetical protein [Candidatus Hydrogenedentota bacterium]HPC15288.1 hypothetical protein [Candidatus Hydrogenedentota bacterium]HRT19243.1 hypothetical protein [Candidatus Hydrogenedentota bacterium]HRT63323.1 hypothetical protein [Candidatus Hydrogenedentota bacterium]
MAHWVLETREFLRPVGQVATTLAPVEAPDQLMLEVVVRDKVVVALADGHSEMVVMELKARMVEMHQESAERDHREHQVDKVLQAHIQMPQIWQIR